MHIQQFLRLQRYLSPAAHTQNKKIKLFYLQYTNKMNIYNKITVLLWTLSYMFRRLLRHLQGEHYRMLETIVTLIADLNIYCTLVEESVDNNTCISLYMCILLVYQRYNYDTNNARNGKLQDMKINLNLNGLPAWGMHTALIGSWRHCCNRINAETFQRSAN